MWTEDGNIKLVKRIKIIVKKVCSMHEYLSQAVICKYETDSNR